VRAIWVYKEDGEKKGKLIAITDLEKKGNCQDI